MYHLHSRPEVLFPSRSNPHLILLYITNLQDLRKFGFKGHFTETEQMAINSMFPFHPQTARFLLCSQNVWQTSHHRWHLISWKGFPTKFNCCSSGDAYPPQDLVIFLDFLDSQISPMVTATGNAGHSAVLTVMVMTVSPLQHQKSWSISIYIGYSSFQDWTLKLTPRRSASLHHSTFATNCSSSVSFQPSTRLPVAACIGLETMILSY